MKKPIIMCIDDEAIILNSLDSELRRHLKDQCIVELAESGEDALELIDQLLTDGEDIAVVVSDYIMPGMKGDELLEKIHQTLPKTLKIMLTGQADVLAVANAVNRAKLYNYIDKPWETNDLMCTIQNALKYYLQEKELEASHIALKQTNQSLYQANHRLEFLINTTEELISIRDIFLVMIQAANSLIREFSTFESTEVQIYFLEKNAKGEEGYAHFQMNMEAKLTHDSLFKLAGVEKVRHHYSTTMPIPREIAVAGCSFADDNLQIPIWHQEKLLGLIQIKLPKGTVFTKEDWRFVEVLVRFLDISLENLDFTIGLEQKIVERTIELKTSLRLQEQISLRFEESQQELNITNRELQRQHRQLQKTQAHLIQSEKMAGLATMVAGTAHELNNPVNYVHIGEQILAAELSLFRKQFFELLGTENDPAIVEHFQEQFNRFFHALASIEEGSNRIKTIVKDLRTFSRLDEAERKEIEMVESLQSILRITQSQFQTRVKFSTDFQSMPKLDCWPAKLNQVFMNIILNACQAIQQKQKDMSDPALGNLIIRTFEKTNKGQKLIAIQFEDNGCGMTEEIKQKLFEPFFTTKPVGQGTGLGMSSAYGIVKEHKGSIDVNSTVGVGTTITVLLPY